MAGFLLAISPWVTRNFVEFQTFIPATTHGGYTLALGNNPDYYRDVINGEATKPWDGEKLDQWQKRMASEARAAGIAIGDEKATDTWMYSQAFQAIQSQPANFVRASWLRIRTFWAISPTGAVSDVQRLLSSIWYAGLWFAIIALILVRLTCRIAKRMPFFSTKSAPIWLTVLAFQLMHTFYWTDARMRAPLMPALAVLVALAFRWTHAFFTGPLTKGAVNDLYLCDTGIPDSGTGRSAERVTSV